MQISELQKLIIDFRDARDWSQFHNPKDMTAALAIEAAELQEKFLWKSVEESYEIGKNNPEVADELADVFAYMLGLAEVCEIDLGQALIDKMEKNEVKYPVEKSKGTVTKYTKL